MSDSNTVESVRLKYQQQLQLLKFRTDFEPYGFSFRRNFRAEYPDEHREEVFSVFREGGISIYTGINRINIDWSVKLDILFFISFFVGIFFGIAMKLLLNYSLTLLVITAILGFLASVATGIVLIFLKIDAINNSCLMNN